MIEYVGRYTHKIATSNHRLAGMDDERVSFRYKDYCHGDAPKLMSLEAMEFICRFALHILLRGFVRIRHFGILSSKVKAEMLPLVQDKLHHPRQPEVLVNESVSVSMAVGQVCSRSHKGIMQRIMDFDFRGPPPFEILKGIFPSEQNLVSSKKGV